MNETKYLFLLPPSTGWISLKDMSTHYDKGLLGNLLDLLSKHIGRPTGRCIHTGMSWMSQDLLVAIYIVTIVLISSITKRGIATNWKRFYSVWMISWNGTCPWQCADFFNRGRWNITHQESACSLHFQILWLVFGLLLIKKKLISTKEVKPLLSFTHCGSKWNKYTAFINVRSEHMPSDKDL